MSPPIGRAVLALSGLGFPLTQLAIRRFGRPGAVAVEGVCGGLLVRDAAMIALGVPGRLRRGPAVLLWLEAARRVAIGALFGIHTVRFRIYLQPDSGRKNGEPEDTFLSGLAPMARGARG